MPGVLKAFIDKHRGGVPKESLLGKAFTCAVNEWPYLIPPPLSQSSPPTPSTTLSSTAAALAALIVPMTAEEIPLFGLPGALGHDHQTNSRDSGGHVLELSGLTGTAEIEQIDQVEISLPSSESYEKADLSASTSDKLKRMEGGR